MLSVLNSPLTERPLVALLRDPDMTARMLDIPARHVIYSPDDPASSVYLILQGQVRTYQQAASGTRRLVEVLGPDDWFGAAALASIDCYGELAEAAEQTAIAVIPADRFLERLSDEPAAAVELIRQMAVKLTAFREDASGMVFEDCRHRLVRALLNLSTSAAATRIGDDVTIHITHQQLAQKVGVARETISLALSELRKRNVLRTGRNQLSFQPTALQELDAIAGDP